MSQRHPTRDRLLNRLQQTILEHMPPPRTDLGLPVLPTRVDRLMQAVEAIHGWVCEFDSRGRMLYASPQIESTLGFSPEECSISPLDGPPTDVSTGTLPCPLRFGNNRFWPG